MNGTILSNRSAVDRNKTDFYATPSEVTVALLDFLESKGLIDPRDLIWEPAYGNGAMMRVMLDRGYAVLGTDLYPQLPGIEGVDFLQTQTPCCDWIITNPPFSKATELFSFKTCFKSLKLKDSSVAAKDNLLPRFFNCMVCSPFFGWQCFIWMDAPFLPTACEADSIRFQYSPPQKQH